MRKDELLALAQRVEALDGPSFTLEMEIARAINPNATRMTVPNNYTVSLDAAMSLVPDGCLFMARTLWDDDKTAGNATVQMYRRQGDSIFWENDRHAVAATPALALTAAALRALAEADSENNSR